MSSLVLHGHFYQPPRENPWTGHIDREMSAHPFSDWNERIHYECYAANARVRLKDRVVNNYRRMSFDFGPTLLEWVERFHPRTYRSLIEADRDSIRENGGHGNAMAHAYIHAILPLCNKRDRKTLIRWGLRDFENRFERTSESLWLPETACDEATLEDLIEESLRFVVLSPQQAGRFRAFGENSWSEGDIDPTRPYRFFHRDGSGRFVDLFFYDGDLAHSIAFGGGLTSSRSFLEGREGFIHLATDGETYGHHFPRGENFLSEVLYREAERCGFEVTNYGAYLEKNAPSHEIELIPGGSSWSCAHGLGRWREHCGCHAGGPDGWTQEWRAPLRKSLDFLRDRAAQFFEEAVGSNAWEVRDRYIAGGSKDEQLQALLQMQKHSLTMYTSCGWFFSELSGLESLLVMKRAARLLDDLDALGADSPREEFLEILAEAKSNLPEMGSGADLFRKGESQKSISPMIPVSSEEIDPFHPRVDMLGAHLEEIENQKGCSFAVWAPRARSVSVVGDFNEWAETANRMVLDDSTGIWSTFVPGANPGDHYKFYIHGVSGQKSLRADPYSFQSEVPPNTASKIFQSGYSFQDRDWVDARLASDPLQKPMSIYEVHLGSWKVGSYREIAPKLAEYVEKMGFTHVEFLPVMEHPFGGSWGYQVTSFFSPTARFGNPDDFRFLVDTLHQRGIGVILDWVPGHFPKDDFALSLFDGKALYEYADPRRGEHPDWGTLVFDYGRKEVRQFLLDSAHFWLEEFHLDGLRLDAVASMLYLDYSRGPGEWVPNIHGGKEDLEAVRFLQQLTESIHARHPGILLLAEESTSWPGVTHPPKEGGLGFDLKWNMGWMHDTLLYFSREPVQRSRHHRNLTFGFMYAWSEKFLLPFSHDEVVHGKGSLLRKMAGKESEKFANLRALYAYMWAHPGKKLLFMGNEFAPWGEWNHDRELEWEYLDRPDHAGVSCLIEDLNRLYRNENPLWEADHNTGGFLWIAANRAEENLVAFLRISPTKGEQICCISNFSRKAKKGVRLGLPVAGKYEEILNTDQEKYGGKESHRGGEVVAESVPQDELPFSGRFDLPPLTTVWYRVP